ncbi:hypothetical protein K8I85_07630, partial [bacterium]|nr:hypothetical protein [bacterium]
MVVSAAACIDRLRKGWRSGREDNASAADALPAPLSAERFHVEFTMTVETKDKLERVLDLMSHANPRRSLATAFDRA